MCMYYTDERKLSVNGGGMKWMDDQVRGGISLTLTSEVRLLRHGIVRYNKLAL